MKKGDYFKKNRVLPTFLLFVFTVKTIFFADPKIAMAEKRPEVTLELETPPFEPVEPFFGNFEIRRRLLLKNLLSTSSVASEKISDGVYIIGDSIVDAFGFFGNSYLNNIKSVARGVVATSEIFSRNLFEIENNFAKVENTYVDGIYKIGDSINDVAVGINVTSEKIRSGVTSNTANAAASLDFAGEKINTTVAHGVANVSGAMSKLSSVYVNGLKSIGRGITNVGGLYKTSIYNVADKITGIVNDEYYSNQLATYRPTTSKNSSVAIVEESETPIENTSSPRTSVIFRGISEDYLERRLATFKDGLDLQSVVTILNKTVKGSNVSTDRIYEAMDETSENAVTGGDLSFNGIDGTFTGDVSIAGALSVTGTTTISGALVANSSAGENGYVLQSTGTGAQWVATSTLGISSGGGTWGSITGTLSAQTDLQSAFDAKLSTTTAASTYTPQTRTLNGLDFSDNQTFATSTSGNDFNISSAGSVHTFNIPDAGAAARGVVTTGTQTFAGAKTFSGAISASNFSGTSSGTNTGDQTITLTGDVTGSGTGSFATTFATVNADTGSFGSSTAIPTFTVNAKGLITAVSTNAVIAPAGTLTGTTLASNVVSSSLTSLGTITTGVWNGTAVTVPYGGTGTTTATAFAVLTGGTTDTGAFQSVSGVGTNGQVLTSNGDGLMPTWQNAASSGLTCVDNLSPIAVGNTNTASGSYSSAIGYCNSATTINSVSVGRSNFIGTGVASVSIGVLNNSAGATLNTSTGVITGTITATSSSASLSTIVGINNTALVGSRLTSVGYSNFTSGGNNHTVVGLCNNVSAASNSTAVGSTNTISAQYSTVLGYFNTVSASAYSSTATGYLNTNSATYTTTLGYCNTASGGCATAIGHRNRATTLNSVSIGRSNFSGTGIGSVAMGIMNNQTGGTYTATTGAITGTPSAANSGCSSVAIGIANSATGYLSQAVGYGNAVSSADATGLTSAFGILNTVASRNSMAFGQSNSVAYSFNSAGSSAFGRGNVVCQSQALAVGHANTSCTQGSLTFGNNNRSCGAYTTASGYQNTASGSYAQAIGAFNCATTANSLVVGRNNYACTNSFASAHFGILNNANGGTLTPSTGAITGTITACAIGCVSTTSGICNTSSGIYSNAFGFKNTSSGARSSSLGVCGIASGARSSALGYNNTSSGNCSIAAGHVNVSSGCCSSAFGFQNTASAYNSSAFGSNINNTVASSTKIGPSDCASLWICCSGVSTTAFQFNGMADGTLSLSGGVLTSSSDERLKNIQGNFVAGLDEIIALNPINYTWKDKTPYDHNTVYGGFSAQNVKEFIPSAISIGPDGYYGLNDRPILAASVNAIKELNTLSLGNIASAQTNLEKISALITLVGENGISASAQELFSKIDIDIATLGNAVEENSSTIETVVGKVDELVTRIESFGASVIDGVLHFTNVVFEKITTKELCIDDVCITKDQLQNLLDNANVTPNPNNPPDQNPPNEIIDSGEIDIPVTEEIVPEEVVVDEVVPVEEEPVVTEDTPPIEVIEEVAPTPEPEPQPEPEPALEPAPASEPAVN